MSFEAIKDIALTEEKAEELKREAQSVAKRYALQKKKDVKLYTDQLIKEAEAENARLMEESVKAANEKLAAAEMENAKSLELFIQKSRCNMKQAEDAIFERIVNG